MAYSVDRLIYWCDKQAIFNEKIVRGTFPSGDGRWTVTDGVVMFILERKPRGLPEIKPENLNGLFRNNSPADINNIAVKLQNPKLLDITNRDLENAKKKLKTEKQKAYQCGETRFDITRLTQAAAVMGNGCRFYCGEKPLGWMWIYQKENMNSFAVIMPLVPFTK